MKRFKKRIKEITSSKQAKSVSMILKNIKVYTTGWPGYYSICDMKARIKSLNEWIRRRIRQIYSKQWKKISARCENLKRLGKGKQKAWKWENTRLGYWRVAGSFILTTTLTNKYLESQGYDDISLRYERLHSNYPTDVYENRMYGDVRGRLLK